MITDPTPLQTVLAAEHAAVYVFGVLGGRVSRSKDPGLAAGVAEAFTAHRLRRDELTAMITAMGQVPVPAEATYDVPAGLDRPGRIARVALDTERACATTYAWLVANSVDEVRRMAIGALNETAVRELVFRGTPEMFPGADEYADR